MTINVTTMPWYLAIKTETCPFGHNPANDDASINPHQKDWEVPFPEDYRLRLVDAFVDVVPWGEGWMLSPRGFEVLSPILDGCNDPVMVDSEPWTFVHMYATNYLDLDRSSFTIYDRDGSILSVEEVVLDPVELGSAHAVRQEGIDEWLVDQVLVDLVTAQGLTGLVFKPIDAGPDALTIYDMKEKFETFLSSTKRSIRTVADTLTTLVAFREQIHADPLFTETDRIEIDWTTLGSETEPMFCVTISRDFGPKPRTDEDFARLSISHYFPSSEITANAQDLFNNDKRSIERVIELVLATPAIASIANTIPVKSETELIHD
jgi:hypothetical protein